MDDKTSRHPKPRIGRRLLGRQAVVARGSGLRLGRAVAGRHERPEPVRAAMRLVPKRETLARSAAPAPAPAAPAAAAEAEAWVASPTESTIAPGMSDWGAEWLFGDADAAMATGTPFMGGAGVAPPTPEEKRIARMKRGAPEVGRGAKILEGDEQLPPPAEPAKVARFPAEPPASTPVTEEPAGKRPVRVSRTPAQPPSSTPAVPAPPDPPGQAAPARSLARRKSSEAASSSGPAAAPATPSGPTAPSGATSSSGPATPRARRPRPSRRPRRRRPARRPRRRRPPRPARRPRRRRPPRPTRRPRPARPSHGRR